MVSTRQNIANPPMHLMGPQNLRELGGYGTVHGCGTAKGRLLRSDGLQALTRSDREALFAYGVRCVIDLRSEPEQKRHPDRFDDFPSVRCLHYPMFDEIPLEEGGSRQPDTLAELYIALLDQAQNALRDVMGAISRAGYGCVLFHCAAGKDRTGIVAMLLLMLAGVPEETIIADYCSSCDNMAVIFAQQKLTMHAKGISVSEPLFRSSREDIEAAMKHLYLRYGDVEGYLRTIGCSAQEIDALRDILLGEVPKHEAV